MQITLPQTNQPVRLWEKLEIVVGDETNAGTYVARIEDIVREGIIVSNPEFVSGSSRLRDNCEVRGLITREDAVYQFYARIKKINIKGVPYFLLADPESFSRVQRRQYVRLELYRDITYTIIKKDSKEPLSVKTLKWQPAKTLNISAGGVLIKCGEPIKRNVILLLKAKLFIEIGLPVTISCVCRRYFKNEQHYNCGLEFIRCDRLQNYFRRSELEQMPESIRFFDHTSQNKLVTFVFQQQIDMRKKGLL